MTLNELLADTDTLLCCGAGGVGKTTAAAALGVHAATELGRTVVVMTVDPARRLADALGVTGIDDVPVNVDLGSIGGRGKGTLQAMMLDPEASWNRLIANLAPDEKTAERLLRNQVYRAVTQQFVQSHDYLAMARLQELRASGNHDLVIVDTPPSRHAVDFLDAPERMIDFFDSRLLRWMTGAGRLGATNIAAVTFQKVADRVLGGGFVSDVGEFFGLLQQLSTGFVDASRSVSETFVSAATATVVVTTPESGPVREAAAFADDLAHRDMTLDGLILNRAVPRELLEPDVVALAAHWRSAAVSEPMSVVHAAAAALHRRASDADAGAMATVGALSEAARWACEVPRATGSIADIAGLRAFGEPWRD